MLETLHLIVEVHVHLLLQKEYTPVLLCSLVMAVQCSLRLGVGERRASGEVHRKDSCAKKSQNLQFIDKGVFSPEHTNEVQFQGQSPLSPELLL